MAVKSEGFVRPSATCRRTPTLRKNLLSQFQTSFLGGLHNVSFQCLEFSCKNTHETIY